MERFQNLLWMSLPKIVTSTQPSTKTRNTVHPPFGANMMAMTMATTSVPAPEPDFFRLPAHGLNLSRLLIMRVDSFGHCRHFREVYYDRKKVTSEWSRFRLPLSSLFRD
jgi:hypothetical protein